MSSAPEPEVLGEFSRVPYMTDEMRRARLEDPSFAEVLGRARAKACREEYDPARHYPHRPQGRSLRRIDPEEEARLEAAIDRFDARGDRPNRYLRGLR